MTNPIASFRKFRLLELLRGARPYEFEEFYQSKNTLMPYDEREDYCNYGYWPEGLETKNPSAALVKLVASPLNLSETDVLLDVGSGLGQPDIDVATSYPVKKIIGVNVSSAQVSYANQKFQQMGLDNIIEHRPLDAREIGQSLKHEGVTSVMSVEALAEISDVKKVFAGAWEILPPGGRISFGDLVSAQHQKSWLRNPWSRLLMAATELVYGDNYRSVDTYARHLEDAGFVDVHIERVGNHVYPFFYEYVRPRLHRLGRRHSIPTFIRLFARYNVWVMNRLFETGQADYAVFSARKA